MPEYCRVTDFDRGTLCALLRDAYSFHPECERHWGAQWREFDDFFYDNPRIADTCGFFSVLNGTPIGFVSWDPRNLPAHVIMGHNCIATAYKGKGYGRAQMREAVRRIGVRADRILVTTNALMTPAQRTYESAGFVFQRRRPNAEDAFSGDYLDYAWARRNGDATEEKIQTGD